MFVLVGSDARPDAELCDGFHTLQMYIGIVVVFLGVDDAFIAMMKHRFRVRPSLCLSRLAYTGTDSPGAQHGRGKQMRFGLLEV